MTKNINLPPRGDEYRRSFSLFSLGLARAQDTPDLTLRVNPVLLQHRGNDWIEYSGGNSKPVVVPTLNYAKWVIVGINSSAEIVNLDGIEAANDPLFPDVPDNVLPLAAVFIEGDDTEITNDMVYDIRPFLKLGTHPQKHSEILNTDEEDLHPISAIEGLQALLNQKVNLSHLLDLLNNKADIDGTPSHKFILNKDESGVPASTVTFEIDRGDQPPVGFRWNEQVNHWEFTVDGTEWIPFSNAGFVDNANASLIGKVRLSVNPEDPQDPIAVGDNDPRMQPATTSTDGLVQVTVDPETGEPARVVSDNDPRNSDSRDPNPHSSSHLEGGSDEIPIATTTNAGLASTGLISRVNEITDDRLFTNLNEKINVINHLTSQSDPHKSKQLHESEFDHSLLFKNIHTPYMVGKEPSDAFNSIQDAVNQVLADEANINGKKAVILIKPGSYVENITLHPSIILSAIGSNKTFSTNITGTISMDFSVNGSFAVLQGLNISSSSDGIQFAGSSRQRLFIYDCHIELTEGNGSCVKMTNTSPLSDIQSRGSSYAISNTNTGRVLDLAGSAKFVGELTGIFSKNSQPCLHMTANSRLDFNMGIIEGTVNILDTSVANIFSSRIDDKGGNITLDSSSVSVFASVAIISSNTPVITGNGNLRYNHIVYLGSTSGIASTITAHEAISTSTSMYSTYETNDPGLWENSPPANVKEAIDRISAALSNHLQIPIS